MMDNKDENKSEDADDATQEDSDDAAQDLSYRGLYRTFKRDYNPSLYRTLDNDAPCDDEAPNKASSWVITFSDIMALMLTFFVMLYAMSVPQEVQWNQMTRGITNSITNFKPPQWYAGAQDTISIDKIETTRALDLDYIETLLKTVQSKNDALKDMRVRGAGDHVVLSFARTALFVDQSAVISPDNAAALFTLSGVLSRLRNRIEIVGIGGDVGEWSAALSRAQSLNTALKAAGYDRDIAVRAQNAHGKKFETDRIYILIMTDGGGVSFL